MALQPGEIVDGKYRIVRLIGEGGMGAVFEGENTRIKRKVAIKVLHPQVAAKADVIRRFEREAQAAGTIGSEHIVEVLDLGSLPSGERFMVMEYLDGEDLSERIRARDRLSPDEAIPLLVQVLEGLEAAHRADIIHRDLKPDNIYVLRSKAGRADFVKILDFGVSKFSALDNDMSLTRTGAVVGTPYYMSPEQAKGGKLDARSDLYAVGVVLYQAITGQVPFLADSFNELLFKIALESPDPVRTLVPDCPESFEKIVHRAMARRPADRYQSAGEFQQALLEWLQAYGQPVEVLGPADLSGAHRAVVLNDADVPSSLAEPGTPPPYSSSEAATRLGGELELSHSPFEVATPPAGKRSGRVAIAVVATLALLGTGAAYLASPNSEGSTNAAAPGRTAAPTGEAVAAHSEDGQPLPDGKSTTMAAASSSQAAEAAETAEARPTAPEPPTLADSGPSPTSTPTAAPTAAPTPAPTAKTGLSAKTASAKPTARQPRSRPATTRRPRRSTKGKTGSRTGGRTVKTEL